MDKDTTKFLNKITMLFAVLIVGILVFLGAQVAYQSSSLDQQNQNQITVSGEGKVYAKPDVALISLGVTTQAETVAEVTKTNTEKMNAVIEAVKALKIDEKDIQTTNYSLTPVYEKTVTPVYSSAVPAAYLVGAENVSSVSPGTSIRTSSNLKGYKLEQNVEVKIRDFTKVGDVLSQTTAKGANLVGDLSFTIDNTDKLKEEARAKAIAQAKTNAKNLAKESGVRLGKIINIYENYIYPTALRSAKLGMGIATSDSAVSTPTIQPGQQEIDVTINLTYKVK